MPYQLSDQREAAFYKTVGSNVRRARELGCLKQGQVADMTDISRPQFCRFESGGRCLTVRESLRVLKILGVSVDYLLEGTSELAEAHRKARSMPKELPPHGRRRMWRCPECGWTAEAVQDAA